MPQDLRRVYPDPGVKEGKDAKLSLAENRAYAKLLAAQHARIVEWFDANRAVTITPPR